MSMKKVYKGRIEVKDEGGVRLESGYEQLAETIADDLKEFGRFVTAHYFVTDNEQEIEELNENLIKTMVGEADADYGSHYSEYTGYLWTDDEINIGGHNLIDELNRHDGKYLYLSIEYSKDPLNHINRET